MSTKPTYKFEMATLDGQIFIWRGLSKAAATAIYKATERQQMHVLKSCGWCLET